jgi:uncharacterized protein YcbK (DUF882 family)
MKSPKDKQRRGILKTLLGTSLASLLPTAGRAAESGDRRLSFYHTHTDKQLNVTYARDGRHIESALTEVNEFLADFRTNHVTTINPNLLDLLFDIRESLGSDGVYEVISAYRSPATNEMLRSQSTGVARNSQHLLGTAIDVRLAGVELTRLRDTSIAMQRGGVGYYEASNFVHIDTGRVRRW